MSNSRKILIIKTGFSEFLDRGISTTVSLGDVLLCTSILHLYKNDHVTWVGSWQAKPLLVDNPYIDKLILFGPDLLKNIRKSGYDIIINLEKDMGLCVFVSRIKAKKHYGFYFSKRTHNIATYKNFTQFLLVGQENQKNIHRSLFEILYETVEKKWKGQGPVNCYKSKQKIKYDIGFNFSVGSKWPTKAWPMKHWKILEKLLGGRYSISWQQGHENLYKYMDWISSCRLIVTSDSLGQVLSQSLGKKVISLFGPTNPQRMKGIPAIKRVASTLKCPFMPCYLPMCKYRKFCMESISPKQIAALCRKLLK